MKNNGAVAFSLWLLGLLQVLLTGLLLTLLIWILLRVVGGNNPAVTIFGLIAIGVLGIGSRINKKPGRITFRPGKAGC
ncbi:hypothetical protein D0Y50_05960 [Salinimonas sediminis]|uniref:Uncharacterized protein n=1 Tax=Salinimonas sediminis TaxID=2303538 RepID=A0A346NKA7_9ALTE|nr:hypothetical protein D0Y50_05960 [Salinimonas sediminis]